MSKLKSILTTDIKPVYLLIGTLLVLIAIFFLPDVYKFYFPGSSPVKSRPPAPSPRRIEQPSEEDQGEIPVALVGKWEANYKFRQPVRMVLSPSNDFYVLDGVGRKVLKFTSGGVLLQEIEIWRYFDNDLHSRERDMGDSVNDIAVDSGSNLYVIYDRTYHCQIQKYSPDGKIIKVWRAENRPLSIAVDGLKNLYIAFAGGYISKFDSDGNFIKRWGSHGHLPGQFWFESDRLSNRMITDEKNNLYVCDTGNNRIQEYDQDGTHILDFGISGVGNGQLESPTGVALGMDGNVNVVDRGNKRIQIFSPGGRWLGKWTSARYGSLLPSSLMFDKGGRVFLVSSDYNKSSIQVFTLPEASVALTETRTVTTRRGGEGPYTFSERWPEYFDNRPTKMVFSSLGYVYFLEKEKNRIWRFPINGIRTPEFTFIEDKLFYYPSDIAIDADSNLYVLSKTYDGPILKFASDGNFITQFSLYTAGDNDLCWGIKGIHPSGIAVDSKKNIYLVDARFDCIYKLDPDGNLIDSWTGDEHGPDRSKFMIDSDRKIVIDNSDNIYLLDKPGGKIQKFNSRGTLLFERGSRGNRDGQFSDPSDVAVSPDGNVHVVDDGNNRIQIFSPDGKWLGKWGRAGLMDGDFRSPKSLAFDKEGRAYVISRGFSSHGYSAGYRIQVFNHNSNYLPTEKEDETSRKMGQATLVSEME